MTCSKKGTISIIRDYIRSEEGNDLYLFFDICYINRGTYNEW